MAYIVYNKCMGLWLNTYQQNQMMRPFVRSKKKNSWSVNTNLVFSHSQTLCKKQKQNNNNKAKDCFVTVPHSMI